MKPHIKQFFKFLEKKEDRKIPLRVKISNPRDFKLSPEDLDVKGNLNLFRTNITSLPNNLTIKGSLFLMTTPIQSLPNNLEVGGSLHLQFTPIQSLPNNLEVGEDLWLNGTSIKLLPGDLKVGGSLYINRTPLAKNYTEGQIRSMVEEKGGYIEKSIYI